MKKEENNKRSAGILLPVFSLASAGGIGCFSAEAYEFIDRLRAGGQSYWQILPMNPPGAANSPYQPLSSFAGTPFFIDLYRLMSDGLLSREEIEGTDLGSSRDRIDYGAQRSHRMDLLHRAFGRLDKVAISGQIRKFEEENSFWLKDYALFMALKNHFGSDVMWSGWPDDIRDRRPEAVKRYENELADEIAFHKWTQFEFSVEWDGIRGYANSSGISTIGDMPFYVSYDSADCWAHPEIFLLDERKRPERIAGVPPDAFSEDGQLWGNPVYDWEAVRNTGYQWWKERVRQNFKTCDVLRIDHFRGFEAYYTCPASAENAKDGTWSKGPGQKFFNAIEQCFENPRFIAEDLGIITDEVTQLRQDAGLPGLKVLQFAFDSDSRNPYLPHNYEKDCVVYTGTHDNNTSRGWFREAGETVRDHFCDYAGIGRGADAESQAAPAMIRLAMESTAQICIIPIQDWLNLDENSRCNTPSTVSGNWSWRMQPHVFTEELAEHIRKQTELYGRI